MAKGIRMHEHLDLTKAARELNVQAFNCLEHGDPQQAVELFESALALLPDSPLLLNNLANACQDLGDYDRAQDLYRKTIALRPDYPHPYRNLAVIYALAGAYDYAIRAYRHYLTLVPEDGEVHFNLGLLLMQQGEVSHAQESLKHAIALLDEDSLESLNALAVSHLLCSDLDEANRCLDRALTLDPENAAALYNRALVALAGFDAEIAQGLLERLHASQPEQWSATVALAALCLCHDEPQKAEALLLPLVEQDIPEPGIYINLGNAARQRKAYHQARDYFRKVLTISEAGGFYYRQAEQELARGDS